MAHKNFRKEDFVQNNEKQYQIEFKKQLVGEGINLIVERLNEKHEYETIQAQITRSNDSIFIIWDQPFDGRIIFEE
ncbi:glutathione synthase [Chryseobacterium pennipullorum]|uniref:Glutathione synthase n=1 Tax=Chryseobacterium pennipullorum TaxID=2258963 RepID=A0A3D9B497_9FLAO|nr:glutathione synthase [Chryseobacterium pennipullorum]REC48086.1 glutathione synthase [Chryseobacterium pennipullorum]